jgi:hypothetical protein
MGALEVAGTTLTLIGQGLSAFRGQRDAERERLRDHQLSAIAVPPHRTARLDEKRWDPDPEPVDQHRLSKLSPVPKSTCTFPYSTEFSMKISPTYVRAQKETAAPSAPPYGPCVGTVHGRTAELEL